MQGKPAFCSSRVDLEGTVLTELSHTPPSGGFWKGQTCCEGEQKAGVRVRARKGEGSSLSSQDESGLRLQHGARLSAPALCVTESGDRTFPAAGEPEGTDVVRKWMRGNLCGVDTHPGATALVLTVSWMEYAAVTLREADILSCFYNQKKIREESFFFFFFFLIFK